MSIEIELKAHISNYKETLNLIRSHENISNEIYQIKKDIYFTKGHHEKPSLRSRLVAFGKDEKSLQKQVLITLKEKQVVDEIETNKEIEFSVDKNDYDQTISFFTALGYSIALKKEKIGYSFNFDYFKEPLHIELIEVPPLGWFLEMEFCLKDDIDENEKLKARANLYEALSIFKVDESLIEKDYYMDLLKKSNKNTIN